MNCNEISLKLQALTDNELEEKEIPFVMNHIESCYRCRNEYIELLQLQRKMSNANYPEPGKEWFEDLHKSTPRKVTSGTAKILLLISYSLLFIWFIYSFFFRTDTNLFVKILTGGIFTSLSVLFGITIADRIRERKDDKYKGVIK